MVSRAKTAEITQPNFVKNTESCYEINQKSIFHPTKLSWHNASIPMPENFNEAKANFRAAADDAPLEDVTIAVARAVAGERTMTPDMRKELVACARAWADYAQANDVQADDLFSIRWHIERFAQDYFNTRELPELQLLSEPIDSLTLPSGELLTDRIKSMAGDEALKNPQVAIFGGVSRTALKLLAVQQGKVPPEEAKELLAPELPMHDVDIVLNKAAVTGKGQFGADVAGTRIVGDIKTEMTTVLRNIDCTFNQSLIYDGNIYYSQEAMDDVIAGVVRFIDKEDALFGAEVDQLPDGKQFINKRGLYRAFAFLLRGKAKEFPIHKDNLEAEMPSMDRYWVILLSVKILPMKDAAQRNQAIERWFTLAKKLGATDAASPKDFLAKLLEAHPEMMRLLTRQESVPEQKFDSQVRWLASKLINRAVTQATNPDGQPPLQGMSDEQVIIDKNYLEGEPSNVGELLEYVEKLKGSA